MPGFPFCFYLLQFVAYASLILNGLPFHANKEFYLQSLERQGHNNNILLCLVKANCQTFLIARYSRFEIPDIRDFSIQDQADI